MAPRGGLGRAVRSFKPWAREVPAAQMGANRSTAQDRSLSRQVPPGRPVQPQTHPDANGSPASRGSISRTMPSWHGGVPQRRFQIKQPTGQPSVRHKKKQSRRQAAARHPFNRQSCPSSQTHHRTGASNSRIGLAPCSASGAVRRDAIKHYGNHQAQVLAAHLAFTDDA